VKSGLWQLGKGQKDKKKHYQTTSQVTAQANFFQGLIYHKVWPINA